MKELIFEEMQNENSNTSATFRQYTGGRDIFSFQSSSLQPTLTLLITNSWLHKKRERSCYY